MKTQLVLVLSLGLAACAGTSTASTPAPVLTNAPTLDISTPITAPAPLLLVEFFGIH